MKIFAAMTVLFVFGGIFPAIGQTVSGVDMFEHLTEEEMLELVSNYLPQSEEIGNNNSSFIRQIGNESTITSIQEQEGNIYNQLIVDQYGWINKGYIKQTGTNHKSVLYQQNEIPDKGNEASLWSIGSNTQNIVYQVGRGNIVNSYIKNNTGFEQMATSVQTGDRNRIDLAMLDLETTNPVGILVTQNGADNSANLILDHFEAPYLSIEQTGGASVIIQHSPFVFPTK